MSTFLSSLSILGSIRTSHNDEMKQPHLTTTDVVWQTRRIVIEDGCLFWYTSETSAQLEGHGWIGSAASLQDASENSENVVSFQLRNDQDKIDLVELKLLDSDANIWKQVVNMHHFGYNCNADKSSQRVRKHKLREIMQSPDAAPLVTIEMNIEETLYRILISSEDNAKQVADKFILGNSIDDDYQSAIELELLRAQLCLAADSERVLGQLRAQHRQSRLALLYAEERAAAADRHADALSNSLNNIELMLPLILPFLSATTAASESETAGNVDQLSCLDSAECKESGDIMLPVSPVSKAGFVGALQALMHHYGYEQPDQRAGSMSAEEWRQLNQEEHLLKRQVARSSNCDEPELDGYDMHQQDDDANSIGDTYSLNSHSSSHRNRRDFSNSSVHSYNSADINKTAPGSKNGVVIKGSGILGRDGEAVYDQYGRVVTTTAGAAAAAPDKPPDARMVASAAVVQTTVSTASRATSIAASSVLDPQEDDTSSMNSSCAIPQSQSQPQQFSWKSRYYMLRKSAKSLSAKLQAAQDELESLKEDVRGMSSARIIEDMNQENLRLREQTVKLRGEILKLQAQIAEVKSSAAHAIQTFSALGREMVMSASAGDSGSGDPTDGANYNYNSNNNVTSPNPPPPPPHDRQQQDQHLDWQQQAERDEGQPGAKYDLNVSTGLSHGGNGSSAQSRALLNGNMQASADDTLEMALSAVLVPIIEDRLLKTIFNKYNSQDGKQLMNSFRYLRCLKDFGITLSEGGEAAAAAPVREGTRWLSYGVVSMVFNDALKFKSEDAQDVSGAGCGTGAGGGTKGSGGSGHALTRGNIHASSSTSSMSRLTSTVITLKGAADPKASSISYKQFIIVLKMLAVRLYSDAIEAAFGLPMEFIGSEKTKDQATRTAFELLLQDKIVPLGLQQDLMPWPLVHLERTLFAFQQIPTVFYAFIPQSDAILQWFLHYAGSAKAAPDTKASSAASASTGVIGARSTSRNGRTLASGSVPIATNLFERRIEDVGTVGLSYKGLSRFTHDFGVVPYLLKEPQLFGLFQELLTWTKADAQVVLEALPQQVAFALRTSLNEAASPHSGNSNTSSAGSLRTSSSSSSAERISFAAFLVALCIIAMQAFPHDLDDRRIVRLLDCLGQGGGPSIVTKRNH